MYADAGEHGLHDHALLEGSVRVSRDVPESLREHLMAEHGRDLYDLMRSPDCLASLHRFEHFEAAVGLISLAHVHPDGALDEPEPREAGTWSR